MEKSNNDEDNDTYFVSAMEKVSLIDFLLFKKVWDIFIRHYFISCQWDSVTLYPLNGWSKQKRIYIKIYLQKKTVEAILFILFLR